LQPIQTQATHMKINFLCTQHRNWLSHQPDEALKCCARYSETGWQLNQQQRWKDALPYMGCAYETASIILSTEALAPDDAREWLMHTLSGLTQTLIKLNHLEVCEYIYEGTMDLLRKEPADSPTSKFNITRQINQLARELRQLRYPGSEISTPTQRLTQSQWSTNVH